MRGGTPLVADVYRMGARDQRPNEARPDMLVYTSEELAKGYTVSLGVYDALYAASSAPDTDFVARLVHVYPDGRAIGVTDGLFRASIRESPSVTPGIITLTWSTLIKPSEVYEYGI